MYKIFSNTQRKSIRNWFVSSTEKYLVTKYVYVEMLK